MTPVAVGGTSTSTKEQLILDPVEIAADRVELDIAAGPIRVRPEGPDWGDAKFVAYMAELERGEAPADGRLPNREVTIPLLIHDAEGITFDEARLMLQAKVALAQREGGCFKRELYDGTKLYLDIVNATLGLGGGSHQARGHVDNEVDLVLETLPDWYGDEEAFTSHAETTLPELVFTETDIRGDYPGRVRIVVDEDDAESQLGLIWGIRCRHYSSASTARLAYEAEALTPLDSATIWSLTGASGSGNNTMRHNSLSTAWTPVVGTNLADGTFLTHTGTYRVKARVHSIPTVSTVHAQSLRLVWDVGDLTHPVENAPWDLPGASQFFIADLGEVRLDKGPVGTHRWQGQIQANGAVGGENIYIDRVWLVPLDEFAGTLKAPANATGLVTHAARDEFNQAAGALTGETLSSGGTWGGAGDADDFAVESTGNTAQRTAVSDTNTNSGRYVAASGTSALTNTWVSIDFKTSVAMTGGNQRLGVLARYADVNNWLRFVTYSYSRFVIEKRVAGTVTALDSQDISGVQLVASTWYTIRMAVFANGNVAAYFGPKGGVLTQVLAATDSALASGGSLASGKAGFYDVHGDAYASTRNFDDFLAWAPALDAVLHPSQSAELRTEGMFREDSTGAAYGPVSYVTGDLPRLPPSGMEDRTVELFLKQSRGDLDQLPDSGIDDISARVYVRPSYLFAPEPA